MGCARLETLPSRFESKVDRSAGPDGCHLWIGYVGPNGYGYINVEGTPVLVHRVAWRLAVGPIPDGHQIDHVHERGCRSKVCVNVAHLEPVTQQENIRRQIAAGRMNYTAGLAAARANRLARRCCTRGHAWAEHGRTRRDGSRYCYACRREREGRA